MKSNIVDLNTLETYTVHYPEEMSRCIDYVAAQVAKRKGIKNYEIK